MRYVGILLVLALIPLLANWLKTKPHQRKWAYAAIGALPFLINAVNLDAAFYVWSTWPGYAKGLVFTALDSLALAILFTHRGALRNLPFQWLVALYIAAAAISVLMSSSPMSSTFYVFQLFRVWLVYAATAAIVTRPGGLRWLAMGLAVGAMFQAYSTIAERLGGALQSAGTMGHQNLLGMMLHFVTLPLFALLLAGERSKLIYAGAASGLLAVALGASRGAIGFVGLGIGIIFALSLARRMTPHKWKIVGFAVLSLAIIGPIMAESLTRRFDEKGAEAEGYDERAAFEKAARMMWTDHPAGVGGNQYVVEINSLGYNNQAGVAWSWTSRSANVHNLYLLTGAELGYLGYFALIALFAWPTFAGLRFAFHKRRDARGDVVMGFAVAIGICGVHGLYEWIFVTYQAQYTFAIALGVVAGFIRQRKVEARSPRRRAPEPVAVNGEVRRPEEVPAAVERGRAAG